MKVISQETFDDVVLENIEEFGNSLEEAIEEAANEFQLQGVQLLSIVKNLKLNDDQEVVHQVLEDLKILEKSLEETKEEAIVSKALTSFTEQCKLTLAHRVLATKYNAYPTLLSTIKRCRSNTKLLAEAIQAMTALTATNSDILNPEGLQEMKELLNVSEGKQQSSHVHECVVSWCLECCLKHENNRQHMVEEGVPKLVIQVLQLRQEEKAIARISLRTLRSFILDDDIRTEFGKSHDHARMLVEEHGLIPLCLTIVKGYLDNSEITSEALATLSKVCVRAEYCQSAVNHEALIIINQILVSFPDHQVLNSQAINLLKTISGNDNVKDQAMKNGVSYLILNAMRTHQKSTSVCLAGLGAVSMMALRSTDNTIRLGQEGAADIVVQIMKVHHNHKQIQIVGCMAVRNLASRAPDNRAALIECQVESVIHSAMENIGEHVKDIAKAALRDLGLDVKLVEQWKGLGVQMQQ